ncbi:hypothetical protein TKK_0004597 [Trichogramma kaykai]|uniref:BTB domain-containing protein n=1 Tax=Trichogramma kaykai TaxID=54128 RepID=A0ABD2XNY8_9HYME
MARANNYTGHEQNVKESCAFTWTIKNNDFNKRGYLESPIFGTEISDKQFYLTLIPAIPVDETGTCLNIKTKSLYLCSKNIVKTLLCKYKLNIFVDEQNVHSSEDYIIIDENKYPIILPSAINKYNDVFSRGRKIIIECELTLSKGNLMSFLDSESTISKKIPKPNFGWIFLDEKFSDVVLRTAGGKVIHAHRLVLATASPVFKDMMSNVEQNQSINMMDISYEVAVEMLRYIYTGGVESGLISLTMELLLAADKYQLEHLKNKCERTLGSNLSTGNAVLIHEIAVRCNMDCLKQKAADYIKLQIKKL